LNTFCDSADYGLLPQSPSKCSSATSTNDMQEELENSRRIKIDCRIQQLSPFLVWGNLNLSTLVFSSGNVRFFLVKPTSVRHSLICKASNDDTVAEYSVALCQKGQEIDIEVFSKK
jgi:hypothetical protein